MDFEIKKSSIHGRGVFAMQMIHQGETLEVCHLLLLNEKETKFLDETKLYDYYFLWDHGSALALGNGSFYNHSYNPNAKYERDFSTTTLKFIALKTIQKGEEITVNYNGDPTSQEKVWFET